MLAKAPGAGSFVTDFTGTKSAVPNALDFIDTHSIEGFTVVAGTHSWPFVTPAGEGFAYKYQGNWTEVNTAGYSIASVYAAAVNVVYFCGYLGAQGLGQHAIWKWTPAGGITKVYPLAGWHGGGLADLHGIGNYMFCCGQFGLMIHASAGDNWVSQGAVMGRWMYRVEVASQNWAFTQDVGAFSDLQGWNGAAWAKLDDYPYGLGVSVRPYCLQWINGSELISICYITTTGLTEIRKWTVAGGYGGILSTHYATDLAFDENGNGISVGNNVLYDTTDWGDTWSVGSLPADTDAAFSCWFEPDTIGPIVTPTDPIKNISGVLPAADISFTVSGQPVSPWTVDIKRSADRDWELALTYDGSVTFEPLFSGPNSSLALVGGVFTITVDPLAPFQNDAVVQVRINASDLAGNPATIA